MKRRFSLKVNRHLVKVSVAAVAFELLFSYLLGWSIGTIVLAAGLVGYQVGLGNGFQHGLDQSHASLLRHELGKVERIEDEMSGELAPDHPARVAVAGIKRALNDELRKVT